MEPVTHALASLLLARAGQKQLPRCGAAMLVVSGVASDLDYLSYFGGASAFLRVHRTLLHSIVGSAVLALIVAGLFYLLDHKRPQKASGSPPSPLPFLPALAVCVVGGAAHVLLDLASGIGVRLLWPFRQGWIAWDVAANLDPWILLILALGIFLPELFRLVSEEIGERKTGPRGQGAAVIALLLLLLYLGTRTDLHSRAIDLLNSREYHGTPPLAVGAFPVSLSPFLWRGIISTDNTIQEAEISLAPGSQFDPDQTVTHYKPQASAAVDAAQNMETAKRFLAYARFPLATLEQSDSGYRLSMHDMRFASNDASPDNIIAIVRLDPSLRAISQVLLYPSSSNH